MKLNCQISNSNHILKKINKKHKVLIVISGDTFFRNYMTSNALSKLKKDYECAYLFSNFLKDKVLQHSILKYFFYSYSKKQRELSQDFFNLLMRRNKKKSKSFAFRILRVDNYAFPRSGTIFEKIIKWSAKIVLLLLRKIKYLLLTSNFIFPYYVKKFIKKLEICKSLLSAIEEIKPSLIIFPSSAYEPETYDLVRICKLKKIRLLFLIDNWDNFSSKSILWNLPDHAGVWGQQSREHGIQIQGFKPSQITPIGTPRFDSYFQLRNRKLQRVFEFKYILFLGTALDFDEIGALIELDKILEGNPSYFKGVKIVYRPHPWRQGRDSILGLGLKNVVIDPQLIDYYSKNLSSSRFQPELDYYPFLLKNAECVIGGLTSMIIESLIFRKCFLALVYNDKKNLTSQHNVLNNYEHLKGIEKIKAIAFCQNLSNLENDFLDLWNTRFSMDFKKIDDQRRYYLYDDARTYSERLADICQELLLSPN